MKCTIDGRNLNLIDTGNPEENQEENGAVLVFLHYFGGSLRTWEPAIRRLEPRHRCVALDLRGWGDSEAPPSGYAVADMADDAAGVIAALKLPSYILVGHSMGGKAAQLLAARRPPGLKSLLLAAPSPLSPEPMTDTERADLRAAWGSREAAEKTLGQIAKRPLPPEWAERVIADNLRASRAAWEAWPDSGSREDLSVFAARIAVPTFVLAGTEDPVLSPEVLTREVVRPIPGAALTTIPGAGHLLPLEAPEAVADWVQACLSA